MKKSEIESYVVYFLMLIMVILLGVFVLRPDINAYNGPFNNIAIALLSFLGTIIIFPICYELSHVLGAKIGHYEVYSVNVLYFNFYKDKEGKTKFRFRSYDGLTGETKIAPIKDKKCSPKAYLWFGNMFLSAILLVSIFMYLSFTGNTSNPGKIIFCVFMIISSAILLYNFLPVELDSKTDGYQLKLLSKSSDIQVYNEYLRIKKCEFYNVDPGEIAVFDTKITNFAAEVDMITVYKLIGQKNFYEANKILTLIIGAKDSLKNNLYLDSLAQKLFLLLYSGKVDEAKEFYDTIFTQDNKKDLSEQITLPCIRAYVLVSALLYPSESEVQYATSHADEAYKFVKDEYKALEKTLYKDALNIAKQAHPSWTLVYGNENTKKQEEKDNTNTENKDE